MPNVEIIKYSIYNKGKVEEYGRDKTGKEGFFSEVSWALCKDGSGKIFMCYNTNSTIVYGFAAKINIAGAKMYSFRKAPIANSMDDLNKKYEKRADGDYNAPTIILRSDGKSGSVRYWKGTATTSTASKATTTTSTAKSKISSAASKVKSVVTGANKTAKVTTTPTAKDKATFSEALPPADVSMTKNLVFQLKDAATKQLSSGTAKITIAYKECDNNGCSGSEGNYKTESFNISKPNGIYTLSLGVTNVPEVKKSIFTGKTTTNSRYFLFYKDKTHLVRHLYIEDINGQNRKEVPIGSYPFATKTEDNAKKFQLKTYIYDKIAAGTSEEVENTTVAPTTTINSSQSSSSSSSSSSTSSSTASSSASSSKTTGEYQTDNTGSTGNGFVNFFKNLLGI